MPSPHIDTGTWSNRQDSSVATPFHPTTGVYTLYGTAVLIISSLGFFMYNFSYILIPGCRASADQVTLHSIVLVFEPSRSLFHLLPHSTEFVD